VARVTRQDLHRLDAVQTTADGGLRVTGRFARVGVLTYSDGAGDTWGELVPPETLFDPSSMETLRGVAVTDLHPGGLVTPETRKALAVGHVGDAIGPDGDYLTGPVYVTDAEEIARVQRGERKDLSCGYTCDLDETPGTFNGQPYRAVQRGRVYNHLGLGPEGWGRAGTDVSLRLDGSTATTPCARVDSATTPTKGTRMKFALKIRGKVVHIDADQPVEVATQDAQGEIDTVVAAADDLATKLKAAESALMEALKSVAALKAAHAAEEAAEPKPVTEADVPEAVADSIVAKRLAKLDAAREGARFVAPTIKLDGLKVRDIHAQVVAAQLPTVKTDGLSDDLLAGMFAGIVEGAKTRGARRADSDRALSAVVDPTVAPTDAHADAAETPVKRQQDALKKWGSAPLGVATLNTHKGS